MKLVAAIAREVHWAIEPRGAARDRTSRAAIVLAIRTEDGRAALGEAAPLGALDDARAALDAFCARMPCELDAIELPACPSARFAITSALRALDPSSQGPIPTAVVVDTPDEARDAVAAGAPCLKLKISPSTIPRIRAIAAAAPGIPLRLDANQTFARADVPALVAAIADLPIDYLEEPCPDAASLPPLAVPVALDESATDGCAIAIVKPTERALAGARTIITHALEGPIGFAAVRAIARALPGIHGVAPHPALAGWPSALSVAAAADEQPDALAIASPPETYRAFAQRAAVAMTSVLPRAIVATPTVDTLATITACLDAHAPLGLVHDRATADEQRRQLALVERATLPHGTAVVLFTSGSTGVPRGVVLSRAALAAATVASAAHLGWRDDDRWLLALSLAHAGGLAVAIRCLAARKPIVLADGDAIALAIARDRATLASLVPTQLAALLDDRAWSPPPHLRAVLLGGAACPPALLEAARARGVPVLPTYGMTETFGQVATARDATSAALVPLPGVTLAIDTTITVRAPMLATAYLEPDGTLVPIAAPFVTRDLGSMLDGALVVTGRADDVIVTGGENVHPATVEAALARTPHVRAAIAFALPDARWGHVVGVALVAESGFDLAVAAAHWRTALPAHARPRRVAIVDALPLLATGKLDRRVASALATRPIEYA